MKNKIHSFLGIFICVLLGISLNAQTTFNYTGSIVTYTVPAGVTCINIEARGAEGGNDPVSTISAGFGATISGDFTVTPGQQLKILVGEQPPRNGGGGGSFVTDNANNPLIIAGGGGGSSITGDNPNKHGLASCDGANGPAGNGGLGGQNGNGGLAGVGGYQTGAGGGLLTDGADGSSSSAGGNSFLNGGAGGAIGFGDGGFGAAGAGSGYIVGGAGGGYSGGGSGSNGTTPTGGGGGGGSYNGGFNAINTSGTNTGHGVVIITLNGNCSGATNPCPGATPPCATTNTFAPMMTSGLYAGAGASDPETYYWGLSSGFIKANPAGGVGPYTYSWSNSAGYAMKGTSNMKARLFYPTGPTWVKVAITDAGAGCTIEDSVYIDWVDYTCNQPDLWFYEMCNINTNTSVCIAGTRNMRDSVKTGNYVFGPCNQPVKTGAIAQSELGVNVFPNPSNGNFTYIVMGDADATFNTQVMDINGRVLFAESFTSSSTISSRQISLQGFAAGVYVIKVSSNESSTVERIIIQ